MHSERFGLDEISEKEWEGVRTLRKDIPTPP